MRQVLEPASFENKPLLTPILMTVPIAPPATASPLKASEIIRMKILGMSCIFLNKTIIAANKYIPTIMGTIFEATIAILFIPPNMTTDTIDATKIPVF